MQDDPVASVTGCIHKRRGTDAILRRSLREGTLVACEVVWAGTRSVFGAELALTSVLSLRDHNGRLKRGAAIELTPVVMAVTLAGSPWRCWRIDLNLLSGNHA